VKRLHEQLFEVRRVNDYIQYDELGQLDTRLMRELYESPGGRGSYNFEADHANLLTFATRFLRSFDRTFYPLLNGQVTLVGVGKAQIFARSFFGVEFSKLRTLLERLEKGAFHFSNFPFGRFVKIKEGSLGAMGNELEVVQLIDDQIAILVDLGKTLSRVLGLSGIGGPPDGEAGPLEPVVLQGRPFRLPHSDTWIQARSMLNQRTVQDALSDAISVCFSAGVHFRDRFIAMFLGREGKFSSEIQAKMRTLENVLDADAIAELKVLYS
jgi:hypothetical protein